MGAQTLKFSSLLNRLRMVGAHVVMSPPAPKGSVWLFGKGNGFFPFSRGPIYPLQDRNGEDLIPGRMIEKILKTLRLGNDDCAQFWKITEHDRIQNQPPQTQ
jgi:hypothetical protein